MSRVSEQINARKVEECVLFLNAKPRIDCFGKICVAKENLRGFKGYDGMKKSTYV